MRTVPDILGRLGRRLRAMTPAARKVSRQNAQQRACGLEMLAAFSKHSGGARFERVLVDGQWDNANYWIRYALFRHALGLSAAREVGILGVHNRGRVAQAFKAFGFAETVDFGLYCERRDGFLGEAQTFLAETNAPMDIHEWQLPGQFPAAILYDAILKRQRRAVVDLSDPDLPAIVAEALSAIALAYELIDSQRPDVLVLSHVVDFTYGSLAWAALARGIPVVALYGDYGTDRFIHLRVPQDIFCYPTRPLQEDAAALSGAAQEALSSAGRRALEDRLGGRTADVSAIYAFKRRRDFVDRGSLAAHFGWNPETSIIGVYAPNWFDYPNGSGRFPFRDFLEWAEVTLNAACSSVHTNWLFKAHPCDDWYGKIRGPRLADLVAATGRENIRLCHTGWNGRALLETIDGVVTVHGTVGLEAAFLGKPVLVPYAGWYGNNGFVHLAQSREDYLSRLSQRWWEACQAGPAAEAASTFAGWYFSAPDWHDDWFLADDSNQDAIWRDLDAEFKRHVRPLMREVAEIADWIEDGHRYFQIFKMRRAEGFVPAHPRALSTSIDEDPRLLQFASAQ